MKAVILAGGKGTRFLPLTESIPKALIPVGSKTLIELVIDRLPSLIDTIIITTNYLGEKIEEKLGATYANKKISYAPQSETMNGTWAALYGTKNFFKPKEFFCVLGCDDFYNTKELEKIINNKKIGMGLTKTTMPAKYHNIAITNNIVTGFERHPHENRETLVEDTFANGFFLLDSSIFSFSPVKLIDGEYGLPQTLLAQKETYPLFALKMETWFPGNTPADIEKIKKELLS